MLIKNIKKSSFLIPLCAAFLFTVLFTGCPGGENDDTSPVDTPDVSGTGTPDQEPVTGPLTPPREVEALSVPGLAYVCTVSRGNLTVTDSFETASLPETPVPLFTYSSPAPARFTGVTRESRYYHADDGGTVTALKIPEATVVWENLMESSPAGPPVILADMLILSRTDGLVNAFGLDSGNLVWSSDLGFPLTACPVYAGGVILAAGVSGITALSPFDGEVLWQGADSSLAAEAVLKISEEFVLLSGSQVLSALNPAAGEILWQVETGTDTGISGAVLNSGEIYAKAENQVELVQTAGEEQPASYYTYADPEAPLRSDGFRLIIQLNGGGLLSVLPDSAGEGWEWYPREPLSSNILAAGDYLIIGSEDRSIYFLLKETGETVRRWETDFIPRALSFGNDILIVSDSAGDIRGYRLD